MLSWASSRYVPPRSEAAGRTRHRRDSTGILANCALFSILQVASSPAVAANISAKKALDTTEPAAASATRSEGDATTKKPLEELANAPVGTGIQGDGFKKC